jgi:DNA-binding transcriptional LysR family regulator
VLRFGHLPDSDMIARRVVLDRLSLLYPRNRQLSPRVRVFIGWLMRAFGRA